MAEPAAGGRGAASYIPMPHLREVETRAVGTRRVVGVLELTF